MAEGKSKSALPGLLVIIGLLVPVLYLSEFSSPGWPKPGDQMPNLKTFPVEGSMPDTTNRVVFLDFYASWCGPCERSFPLLKEFHGLYKDRGLLVIAVNLDEDPEDMKRFLRRHPSEITLVRDNFGHLAQAFNASVLPRAFVIGADGKIAASHSGYNPVTGRQQYIKEIEAALKAAGR